MVTLTNIEANPYLVMILAIGEMKKEGLKLPEIDRLIVKAKQGDFRHTCKTLNKYVEVI